MYVTYENAQYCIKNWGEIARHPRVPFVSLTTSLPSQAPTSVECNGIDLPAISPPSDFRPTRLVRTSDMTVVPGSEAVEGYCALSYPWIWSGDIVRQEGEKTSRRIDHGKHRHIEHPTARHRLIDVPDSMGNTLFHPFMQIATRQVRFEEIIQQLCWLFKIDYIWFDQLCIAQGNDHDKQNEMRQMHSIYSNAQYTLVMIPEMEYNYNLKDVSPGADIKECVHQIATSKWAQRAWTFEEAVVSKRMLFVGRNVHLWSDTISSTESWRPSNNDIYLRYVQNLCTITPKKISASSALWHIHRGESTQDHDKIFALANIFPELMDDIKDFSYNQPLLPLMIKFYNGLVQRDLSVLCFGCADDEDAVYATVDPTQKVTAPSWTGVTGSHMLQTPDRPSAPKSSFARYFVSDEGYLSMYSKSISVQLETLDFSPDPFAAYMYDVERKRQYNEDVEEFTPLIAYMDFASYHHIRSYGLARTHCLRRAAFQTTAPGLRRISGKNTSSITVWFSLTDKNCRGCVILTDVSFDIDMEGFKAYPVVVRLGRCYYTAIGMCFARNLHLLRTGDEDVDEFTIR